LAPAGLKTGRSVKISRVRVILLTTATLVCFSANSLLTRAALDGGRLDWPTFTIVRLASGTVMLWLLVRARTAPAAERGSWLGAAALAGYAVAFTLAYTRIGAAAGALLLFGAVQATMIGVGLVRGERPARIDWLGVVLAVAGLIVLTRPGTMRPDLTGAVLMVAAGVCWGVYSLLGRRSRDPLATTTGNFARATLLALVAVAVLLTRMHITWPGLALAVASGAIASGVGYTIWYTVLPSLAAWRAAVVQLIVPVLTAAAAVVLLGEGITGRLVLAAALIAAGVALTQLSAFAPPALRRDKPTDR
jgi:drug/metabolite transporter (DMT)-like permease